MKTLFPHRSGEGVAVVENPSAPPSPRTSPPTISVVIAWVNSMDLLVPGLEALAKQQSKGPDEVIVVTRRTEDEQKRLCRLFPSVILLSAPPRTPITALRSLGLKQARGTVVAVTEDHCVPDPYWISRLVEHFAHGDCDVLGGPVENASTSRLRDWAGFLTEYASLVQSDHDQSSSVAIPGNNVAYRRDLVDELCATLDNGQWESFYHLRLAKRGVRLAFDPKMLVYHRRGFDFWYFVGQRYHFCRSFAAMRRPSLTSVGKMTYGFASPLLPPLLVARGLAALVRKRRLVGRYVMCLPLIAIYVTVGAVGEMVGYFVGGADSLERVE